jgi:S-adenosylmethionine decarboxylase
MPVNSTTGAFSHLIADFSGVPAAQLSDTSLITGLLIAAAGAAGFVTIGSPVVRQLPADGVAAILVLDGCHVTVHAFPDRELLLLDVLTLATQDPRKALDVFTRRLGAKEIRSDVRSRG